MRRRNAFIVHAAHTVRMRNAFIVNRPLTMNNSITRYVSNSARTEIGNIILFEDLQLLPGRRQFPNRLRSAPVFPLESQLQPQIRIPIWGRPNSGYRIRHVSHRHAPTAHIQIPQLGTFLSEFYQVIARNRRAKINIRGHST